jgi:hypothetical protein
MAKTFYGYAERQAEDHVDWSLIGKDITDMLQEEVQRRDKLKADIDDATRKYGETLSNAPTGQHKGASDGVLEFASNAQQARLIQDRLLKSGQLKVKDYLKQRQNLTDGTKGLFAAAKDFQALYQTKVDKMTEGESARLEMYLFEMSEGFGNWNTAGAYINPTTYEVSLGKKHKVKGKDGNYVYEMGDRPEEYFTIAELRNYISLDLKRFDTRGALDSAAEALGKRSEKITYQTTIDGVKGTRTINVADISGEVYKKLIAQGVLTDDQIGVIDAFEKYKETIVNEMTAIPYNELSILTDYIKVGEDGKQFAFVWSEEERKEVEADGKEAILLEKDPQSGRPNVLLTPEQKGYIGDKITMGLEQRLDQSVTDTFTPTPKEKKGGSNWKPPSEGSQGATSSVEDMWSSWIRPLFTGTENEIVDSLSRLANSKKDVKEARLVKNQDGSTSLVYEMFKGDNVEVFNVSEQDLVGGAITGDVLRKITGSIFYNAYIPLITGKKTEYKKVIDSADLGGIKMVNYGLMTSMKDNSRITSRKKELNYVPDLLTGGTKDAEKRTFNESLVTKIAAMPNSNNAPAMERAIKDSYQRLPSGAKSMDQNPFNESNFQIVETLTSAEAWKYKDDATWAKNSQAMVLRLPGLGPDLLIPVSSNYNTNTPVLMNLLEEKIRNNEEYTLAEVAALYGSYEGYVLEFLTNWNNRAGSGGGKTLTMKQIKDKFPDFNKQEIIDYFNNQ